MKVFKKISKGIQVSREDALKCIPVKNIQITESRLESGEIIIRYPITMRPWIAGLVKRFGHPQDKNQTKKLQLDELGVAVWNLIDGSRPVRQIIQAVAESHRLQLRAAEVAVTEFLRELGKRGLIGMQ
jgi:hypothetical protein